MSRGAPLSRRPHPPALPPTPQLPPTVIQNPLDAKHVGKHMLPDDLPRVIPARLHQDCTPFT